MNNHAGTIQVHKQGEDISRKHPMSCNYPASKFGVGDCKFVSLDNNTTNLPQFVYIFLVAIYLAFFRHCFQKI